MSGGAMKGTFHPPPEQCGDPRKICDFVFPIPKSAIPPPGRFVILCLKNQQVQFSPTELYNAPHPPSREKFLNSTLSKLSLSAILLDIVPRDQKINWKNVSSRRYYISGRVPHSRCVCVRVILVSYGFTGSTGLDYAYVFKHIVYVLYIT